MRAFRTRGFVICCSTSVERRRIMADQGPDPACVCEGGLALAALIADTFATGDLQKALAVALSPTPDQLKDELEKIRREHKGKDYAGGGCGCWVGGYDYTN